MKDDIYNPYPGNDIHPTAIVYDYVEMGTGNKIGPYTVIGGDGEIRGVRNFAGKVIIGDNNVISEMVTIQRPEAIERSTVIGNGNIIMAHVHIGHDAKIGDDCEICTGSVVGGYAAIESGAKVKLNCTIRNRKTVGRGAVVGMGSVVTKDVEPGNVVYGNPAKPKI